MARSDGHIHLFRDFKLTSLPLWARGARVRNLIDEPSMLVDLLSQTSVKKTMVGELAIFKHSIEPESIVAALSSMKVVGVVCDGTGFRQVGEVP